VHYVTFISNSRMHLLQNVHLYGEIGRQTERQTEARTNTVTSAGFEDVSKRLMLINERRACDVEVCRKRVAERRSNATVARHRRTVCCELEGAFCEQRVTWTKHCEYHTHTHTHTHTPHTHTHTHTHTHK